MFNIFKSTPSKTPSESIDDVEKPEAITSKSILKEISAAQVRSVNPMLQEVPEADEIEYLVIQENPYMKSKPQTGSFGPLPMRGWGDKIQYGTGSMYLIGMASGGSYGIIRGLRKAQGTSFKLRLNSLLNTTTRYGPWAANAMGVMSIFVLFLLQALGWAITDTLLENSRGEKDYWNHIPAAFITGFLFKSTAGLKPATIQGALLASLVSSYYVWEKYNSNELKMPQLGWISSEKVNAQ